MDIELQKPTTITSGVVAVRGSELSWALAASSNMLSLTQQKSNAESRVWARKIIGVQA